MADQNYLDEEEEQADASKRDKPVTVSERLDEIISLVEQQQEQEVLELLRYPNGLLHEACNRGSPDLVKLLLERGVSTAEWDKSYLLPLHIVARNNLLEVGKVLLEHDSEGVDRPSKFGETPLHFACLKGHKEMAELLVSYKANVERRDHCDNTTLHYAVGSDNPELVEWLLRDKNMFLLINAKNTFHDTPLHRAAVLQCLKVIPVLIKYRVKLSAKDKNNFTPSEIATILYNNEKITILPNGEEVREFIVPIRSPKKLPSLSDHDHYRSSSFSVTTSIPGSLKDGSTVSLPASGGLLRKKPSATQAKRPVNLSFSNDYSRQVSSGSSSIGGSRGSGIYLRDKDHANRLSQALDKQRLNENVHKIVLDQTAYEPPVDMSFVGDVVSEEVSNSNPRFLAKEHDIRVKINEKHWVHYPSDLVQCRLAAGLHWGHPFPTGHVFISPICFLSCRAKSPVEVRVSLPHALAAPTEASLKKVAIFSSPTVSSRVSFPSSREFRRLPTPDLKVDSSYASFTTTLSDPSLFVVGIATAPLTSTGGVSSTSFPVAPLQCCLYVASPSDQDQYLTNTDIWIYVGMNLKTVETAMKRHVVPHDFSLEEKHFFLSGSVLSVSGEIENNSSDWESSRRGKGLFRYTQVALSPDTVQEVVSHHDTYPAREAFFVECHNPKRALKFRVSVICDNNELVNMLVTPYTPPKVSTRLGMQHFRETPESPDDIGSSTEDIPLRTSSV